MGAVNVMSFNIWSDAPRNARWSLRRENITRLVQNAAPGIVGFQESTWPMAAGL